MRKLLILSIFPLLAAAGCADDGFLHRVEVWKQQTLFGPSQPQVVASECAPAGMPMCAEPACGGAAAPVAVAEPTCEAPVSQTVGSPEIIDGAAEQQ
jgi:hypothetical protein